MGSIIKIVIKDNVYIGSGAYILPGVTIESNVIVGARSVVTKSVPCGVVVAGNPAKIVCTTDELKRKLIPFNINTKSLTQEEKRRYLLNKARLDQFLSKTFLAK